MRMSVCDVEVVFGFCNNSCIHEIIVLRFCSYVLDYFCKIRFVSKFIYHLFN